MDSQALQNAKRQREEVARELNKVAARHDELKRLVARIDQFIGDHEAFEANELPKEQNKEPVVWRTSFLVPRPNLNIALAPAKPRNSKKETVAAAARNLITSRMEPIQRPDLLKALQADGLIIDGSSPETVLSTMLWRTRDTDIGLVHLRGHGYWLKELPYADAHYDPLIDDIIGAADYEPPDGVTEASGGFGGAGDEE